jgi:hypothetical protein
MGYLGIIGIGFCVFAAIWNLADDNTGSPSTAAIWLILAGVIVACSRWLRARKSEAGEATDG